MSRGDFRSVYLPYCLQRFADGTYVILNRAYKPIGFHTEGFVIYNEYPIAAHIPGMTIEIAAQLSWNADPSLDRIYLYNDSTDLVDTTNLMRSEENMNAYLERLGILSKLKLKPLA